MTPTRFDLHIDLGNDAMQTGEDVAEALRRIATKLERSGHESGLVMDLNGNKVGTWELSEGKE